MKKKRKIGIAVVALVCIVLVGMGHTLSKEKKCKVLDADGALIGEIVYQNKEVRYECEDGCVAYMDLAYREAAAIMGEREGLEESEAFGRLAANEMCIRTAFRQDVAESLKKVCEEEEVLAFSKLASEKAAAVSDTKGHILACYSLSWTDSFCNYVTYPTYAGSTIKPISVYAPAVQDNLISWSSLYEDSACYQIIDENGEKKDWPTNTHPYSYTMWTVQEALQKSNNAIAVKVLKEYGVEKSCRLLQDEFGIGTRAEQESLMKKGEDSVLSNLALGYLEEGVTMQEMMGAYQTFASGGIYNAMHTVTGMESKEGDIYYQEETQARQIFAADTAYIVNRMMKTVVEEGGTGEAAGVEGLDICGKTGTSNDFKDNWFIGMTPEYVCAVWYEYRGGLSGNESAAVFRAIMENLKHDKEAAYPVPDNIVEGIYCHKTGLLANEYCKDQRQGYYMKENIPNKCGCNIEKQYLITYNNNDIFD